MGNRKFMLLEDVDIVLSAAILENAVFRARGPGGLVIRLWCEMDEDDIIEALVHELTEISIGVALKSLGYSKNLESIKFEDTEGSIPHILMQISLDRG